MTETTIMRKCLLELSRIGRYFRNNVGQYKGHDGRIYRYGLAVGSSDIIGVTPIVVTNKMVGQKVGLFTAIEVKSEKGKPRTEQLAFIDMVKNQGGIAGIARSDDESLDIIKKYIESMK